MSWYAYCVLQSNISYSSQVKLQFLSLKTTSREYFKTFKILCKNGMEIIVCKLGHKDLNELQDVRSCLH